MAELLLDHLISKIKIVALDLAKNMAKLSEIAGELQAYKEVQRDPDESCTPDP